MREEIREMHKAIIDRFVEKMDIKEAAFPYPDVVQSTNRDRAYATRVLREAAPLAMQLLRMTPNELLALEILLEHYLGDQYRSKSSRSQNPIQTLRSLRSPNRDQDSG